MVVSHTTVIIIGAGSAGLLLAQGLKNAQIPFQVFERHSSSSITREWGMSMHWGGEFLSLVLSPELRRRLSEIDTDPHYDSTKDGGYVMANGESGEQLVMMLGVMPRRVSRRKLRTLLNQGLRVDYEKTLTEIDVSSGVAVPATFADGSSAIGKCLVGCDGSRSKVRELMVNDAKLSSNFDAGCTIINFPYQYDEEISKSLRAIHPVMKVAYHPKTNVMYLLAILDGASSDPNDWTYQHVISWAGAPYASDLTTPEVRVSRLQEIGAPFAHPWRTAAESVADSSTAIFVDAGTSWDPRAVFKAVFGDDEKPRSTTWNGNDWHGLVTLAGDAAHVMLPHRGQGLNNALEDAARLVKALSSIFTAEDEMSSTTSLRSAKVQSKIAAYEAEMVARGGAEVELTLKQSKAAHNFEMLMQSPMMKHGANKARS